MDNVALSPWRSMGHRSSHSKSRDYVSKVENCSGEVNSKMGFIKNLAYMCQKLSSTDVITFRATCNQFCNSIFNSKKKNCKTGQKCWSYAIDIFCILVVSIVISLLLSSVD